MTRLRVGHPRNMRLVPGGSNRFLFPRFQTRSSAHTVYCAMGTRSISSREYSDRSMNANPNLVQSLRMSGNITPLPIIPSWPAQTQPYLWGYFSPLIPARWAQCFSPFLPEVLKSAPSVVSFPNPVCPQAPCFFSESTWPINQDVLMWAGFIWRFFYCGTWRRAIGSWSFTNETYPPLKMGEHRQQAGNRIAIDKASCRRT
jgi:hypothetical protein